jgi:hypothetical protein
VPTSFAFWSASVGGEFGFDPGFRVHRHLLRLVAEAMKATIRRGIEGIKPINA